MTRRPPESEDVGRARERRRYLTGAAVTLVTTALAFALVAWSGLSSGVLMPGIAGLALIQIAAHFHYFLHIDIRRSHRDDLLLVLFTALIVLLMVGGTLWILADQWSRM
ncbi:cytochrome o ubiquinol oxidase subunit IV [Celeribacter indicus]|uniref:Cytochrome bo(3) ubiquinol oxidase subunit 4 n=1 Tax=Celeribacter indicus TaxID=1208324 RepID=A0A0B5E6K7_9RHOB|nr:cytochrome C oxidase subunit IV family protein [Celeribacter indicus]AJE49090.1 cytochrome C oxidase subunit IV [Celeribacter indicus]SDW45658.1 cytochrome o ubiquinol oxidase operon protein cyoD [Celeribacter indicus]